MEYPSTATVETTQSELVSGDTLVTLHANAYSGDPRLFTLSFSKSDGRLRLLERYTDPVGESGVLTGTKEIPVVYDGDWSVDYGRIQEELGC
ncbi:hypothetical protein [Halococcus hamelinensis]|uniref:Uncharacterized protein n=1 Tax=Halococcus hamelinensis 100A6 TaxID=1132509 RepID=M0M090_9EURY|nr:hypothetical protein [Halococcus hamelinensis]EMA37800.1 hypothetical protein C447_12545 [Halococcus hamelinensis 100A6]